MVVNITIQKGKKWKEKRNHQSQALQKSSWANSIKACEEVAQLCSELVAALPKSSFSFHER